MPDAFSVVTRKGQITVPVEIRRSLGLKEGDRVALSIAEGEPGQAILRPVRSIARMTFGAVTARQGPEDLDEVRKVFVEELAERSSRWVSNEKGSA